MALRRHALVPISGRLCRLFCVYSAAASSVPLQTFNSSAGNPLFSPRDSRYYSVNPYLMVECLPETRAVVSLSREMTDSIIEKSKKVKLGQAVKKVYTCVLSPLVPKVWNLSCQHRRFQFQLLAKIN